MTTYAVSETGEHVTYRWCCSKCNQAGAPWANKAACEGEYHVPIPQTPEECRAAGLTWLGKPD